MKIVLIIFIVAGAVVGATQFGVFSKIKQFSPSLPSLPHVSLPKMPDIKLSKNEPNSTSEPSALQGKVAGITTGAQIALQGVSTLFLSNTASSGATIDMGGVVGQISKQVEGIPSHLLEQAKVQYCLQVLAQATKSAEKKIE
jgi:hypothetical protein